MPEEQTGHDSPRFWRGQNVFVVMAGGGVVIIPDHHIWGSFCIAIGVLGFLYSSRREPMKMRMSSAIWILALAMTWAAIGYDYYDRRRHPLVTPDNVQNYLKEWLYGQRFAIQNPLEAFPGAPSPLKFWIRVTGVNPNHPILIAQPKGMDRYLTIGTVINFSDQTKKKFSTLSKVDTDVAFHEVEREITLLGMTYLGIDRELHPFFIGKQVPVSGLNEAILLECIQNIESGTTLTLDSLRIALERPKQTPQ